MLKLDRFLKLYSPLIWVISMSTLCILDICVIAIDFNIWSLIGAICCGISAVLNFMEWHRRKDKVNM